MPDAAPLTPVEMRVHSLSFGDSPQFYLPEKGQRYWGFQENAMFDALLRRIRPKLALEIGSYRGLRLSAMSRYAQRVISLDVDPTVPTRLRDAFPNVDFVTGNSSVALPKLLGELSAENAPLEFAFVDGDHTRASVRVDAQAFLDYVPATELHVLFHDSFNPECRQGILDAGWKECRHCHYIEMDYVPGVLHPDEAIRNTMWGGLALAVFKPGKREGPLEIRQTLRGMYEACLKASVYA